MTREFILSEIGKLFNSLLTLTESDHQTLLVCITKLKQLGIDITIPNFKNDLLQYLKQYKSENNLIKVVIAMAHSNIQRRPGQKKWKEVNEVLKERIIELNECLEPNEEKYENINLNFKKPKVSNLPKQKKESLLSGDRIANDTIDLNETESNEEDIKAKKQEVIKTEVKKIKNTKNIKPRSKKETNITTEQSFINDNENIKKIINKKGSVLSIPIKKFIIQIYELTEDGNLIIVENLKGDNLVIDKNITTFNNIQRNAIIDISMHNFELYN